MLRHIHACQVSVIKSRLDETVWFGDMTPVRDPDDAPDILGTHFAGLPSPTRVFMHTDTSYAHTCAYTLILTRVTRAGLGACV